MRTILPWLIIAISVLSGIALLVYNAMRADEDLDEGDLPAAGGLAVTAAERPKVEVEKPMDKKDAAREAAKK